MKCFHRTKTENVDAILTEGFRDATGYYLTASEASGVWFSAEEALDDNAGAKGDVILCVEIPEELFAEYEWKEVGKPYREALIPAAVANEYPRTLLTHDCSGMTAADIEQAATFRERSRPAEARRLREVVLPFLRRHGLLATDGPRN